jgi:membrane protein YqaA with SNARE-associated domain
MRSLSHRMIALCASPAGVVVLAALDSTVFLNLPLGIDAVIVILAARLQRSWWIVPLLATLGSIAGAALSFWMGIKVGEKGLDRYVPPKRLDRIRTRIRNSGAIALAVLDLIPPPFPFTAFVIAAGALEVKTSTFFTTLALCRLLRFGAEAALAATYGKRIVAWLESDLFQDIATFLIVVATGLTAWSTVHLIRSQRPEKRRAAAA